MAHQALKITYDICLNNVKVQIADISDLLYNIIFDTNVFGCESSPISRNVRSSVR